MERIELGDFLLIAEIHAGTRAEDLARMPRVLALGGSALAAPFAGFGDFEAYPAFEDKAGIYCSRIVANHPLPDGNKRTGYDTMMEFIERNGWVFEHANGDLMQTAETIEQLAAGTLPEDRFLAWVRERIRTP